MTQRPLRLLMLDGFTLYEEAHTLQRGTVSRRIANEVPDTLIILEHRAVITLGRNANAENVLAPPKELRKAGISIHRVDRGGDVTYHGPGQVVGYAIIDLQEINMALEKFIDGVEETIIRASAALGVKATRRKGFTGVFCHTGKIGAIGVRYTRGITYHGFSLNVNPDMSHFKYIIPCGTAHANVSSIAEARGGRPPDIKEAKKAVVDAFAEVFDRKIFRV